MVQLTRIYTKGGDTGKSSLGTGQRLYKNEVRFEAIGVVDETNAFVAAASNQAKGDVHTLLVRIQNDLFDVGADLCMPEEKSPEGVLRVSEKQVVYLENQIDHYNQNLPPLNSFVLPGGAPLATSLHIARTVARRAERIVTALHRQETLNPFLIQYMNRLSDLLFVLARYVNHILEEQDDVLWKPGENR